MKRWDEWMEYKQNKIQKDINSLKRHWATKEFIQAYVYERAKKEWLQREMLYKKKVVYIQ